MRVFDWEFDLESTSTETSATTRETPFGDGYVQSAYAGLNPLRDTVEVTMTDVEHAKFLEVREFIRPGLRVDPFEWTAPGDTVARVWRAMTWRATPTKRGTWNVQMQFEQWHMAV